MGEGINQSEYELNCWQESADRMKQEEANQEELKQESIEIKKALNLY